MAESSRVTPSGPTIRAQAKNKRTNQAGGSGQDRQVERAALASPLTVPWPNIPRHLQRTLLHALPQIVPSEVADYHVSRQRCHRAEKRQRANKSLKAAKGEVGANAPEPPTAGGGESSTNGGSTGGKKGDLKRPASASLLGGPSKKAKGAAAVGRPAKDRPAPPEILSHIVLGINEVTKSLERQIGELRIRIMIMGDALNGQLKPKSSAAQPLPDAESGLLPTAPMDVDLALPAPAPPPNLQKLQNAPLMWIFIPLASISPQSLVTPIPQYCATYNTLVFQYTHLAKMCRTRLPSSSLDVVLGSTPDEVRVVPMARVEAEMAELVGLRRLACLGVRASHPAIEVLHGLLPKSVLHPPRLSLTLPLPTSSLHIYSSITALPPMPAHAAKPETAPAPSIHPTTAKKEISQPKSTKAIPAAPAGTGAFIHYAPLHVKGITTTIPADANARKAKRMEEVRAKRREAKEQKRLGKMGKKEARKAREAVLAITA